jgi:hypothetical protein
MAVEQIPFTRGGINYILNIGIDENGNSVDYIDRIQPDNKNNIIRYYPSKTIIERDKVGKKGGVSAINTQYFSGVVGGDGEIVEGSDKEISFLTGKIDIKYFIAGLGMPIMRSGNNGFIRHPLGFNLLPIFTANGGVITYTEEQENSEPTKDYWEQTNPIEPTE